MGETSYRFAPHPSSGFLLGLRIPQLLGFILTGALALAALRLGGLGGLALALALLATRRSRAAGARARAHHRAVGAGDRALPASPATAPAPRFLSQRAQLGHVVSLPTGSLTLSGPASRGRSQPSSRTSSFSRASSCSTTTPASASSRTRGRARSPPRCRSADARSRCSDPAEREQRLADYGAVLAALARDDSAVRRIAWIERTLPGDGDELGDYLLQAKRTDARLDEPPEELVSYLQLIGRAGDVAEEHELTFALQIDAQRPAARRAITRMGGGDLGALAVLAGEARGS